MHFSSPKFHYKMYNNVINDYINLGKAIYKQRQLMITQKNYTKEPKRGLDLGQTDSATYQLADSEKAFNFSESQISYL